MKSKLKIKAKSNERVITASFNLKQVLMHMGTQDLFIIPGD